MRWTTTFLVALVLASASSSARAQDIGNLFNTGCIVTASNAHGCFLTTARGPGAPGELARGSKEGKACGWNLLALISVGDVRITTAMEQGGISKISSVDHYAFELIPGFYGFSRYCTIVSGE